MMNNFKHTIMINHHMWDLSIMIASRLFKTVFKVKFILLVEYIVYYRYLNLFTY